MGDTSTGATQLLKEEQEEEERKSDCRSKMEKNEGRRSRSSRRPLTLRKCEGSWSGGEQVTLSFL